MLRYFLVSNLFIGLGVVMPYSAIKNRKKLIGKTIYSTKLGRYGTGLVGSLLLLYGLVFLVRAFGV